MHYVCGDLGDTAAFEELGRKLTEAEGTDGANRLFYFAIAPSLHRLAAEGLRDAGLTTEESGWRRVIIEKPFGKDEESARELNRALHNVFREDQTFRIDHYLGKETVQNLLVLRFGNAIFEPLWNRNYVDNVQVTVSEAVDVEGRAGYYDASGVVRDMIQNHLMQLMCLVAMEPPNPWHPNRSATGKATFCAQCADGLRRSSAGMPSARSTRVTSTSRASRQAR